MKRTEFAICKHDAYLAYSGCHVIELIGSRDVRAIGCTHRFLRAGLALPPQHYGEFQRCEGSTGPFASLNRSLPQCIQPECELEEEGAHLISPKESIPRSILQALKNVNKLRDSMLANEFRKGFCIGPVERLGASFQLSHVELRASLEFVVVNRGCFLT